MTSLSKEDILPSSGMLSQGQEPDTPPEHSQKESCSPEVLVGSAGFSLSVSNPMQCWANGAVSCTTNTVNVSITHHWSHLKDFSIPFHACFFSDEKRVQKPMLKGNQVLNTCSYLGQQLNKGCLKLEQALRTHFLKRRSNKTSILRLKYAISFHSGSSAYCWAPF